MAYETYETSNSDGRPVALYEFKYGNTYWRYCTADEDQTVGLDENDDPAVWLAQAITDGGVVQGGSDQNDLQITTQANNPVAALFRNAQPSGKVWLTVRRWHIGDPDDETPLLWSGTVVNATLTDEATVEMSCRSLGGSYDRQGLRLAWGRMCPHVLYSSFGCKVDKSLHAYEYQIITLTGTNFTAGLFDTADPPAPIPDSFTQPAEGTFTGGFLETVRADGSFQRYGIEQQIGNDFAVLGTTDGLEVGDAITLYPGCPRNTTGCKLFDNLPNYGGFPHLPGKSPFDGSPVF